MRLVQDNIPFSKVNTLSKADAAQWYAKQGLPVFPCVPGGKEPMVRWTEEATTDPWKIEMFWLRWPNANIGLAMGGDAGWVALDLDQGVGKDGWSSYKAAGGPLIHPWPEQTTPNNGLHLLWRCGWLANEFSNFARRGSAGGVDMRVDRGYIVAAPSVVEGRSYAWTDGNPDAPVAGDLLAACLDWSTHRETLDIEVPLAADLGEAELASMVKWLEERREEGTGDQSRDAYLAFKVAFQVLGWDLAVAAAVLPECWVGEFGAAPPHGAGNPVAWAWKYVVMSAWRDSGRQKEGPVFTPVEPEGSVNAGPRQEEGHAKTGVDGGGGTEFPAAGPLVKRESAATVDTSYSAHRAACAQLPPNDYPAMAALVEHVVACALPESQQLALWAEVKRFSGYPIGVVKAVAKEAADKLRRLAEEAREREAQGKVASPLTPLYVMAQDRVLLPVSGALVSRPAFLTEKAREHEGQRDVAEQVWLTGEQARCPVVSDITYHPGLPSGVVADGRGVTLYNTYKPSELVPRGDGSAESVRPWLDLLDSLQLEEGERGKEWLLDRLAAAVQYPGRKVNHGILMGGKPGIGKDSFLAPWLDSVGRGNVNIVDGSEMASGFNSWAAGCKVAVVNEIDWGDHKDRRLVQEKLKRVLAAPPETLTINEKNLRPYDIPNLLQVVGFTNHRQCLSVDQGERRYLALWCRLDIPPSGEVSRAWGDWFASYWGWLKRGSAAVLAYLRARVINIDEVAGGRPPVTAWLEELMESSADGLAVWLRDAADARVGPFIADVVTPKLLLDWIATGAGGYHIEGYVGRRRLDRAMQFIGWTKGQRSSWRRGEGGIEWSRPGVVRADPAMDHAEARKTARILQMDSRQRKDLARRGKLPEQAFQMLYGDAPRPGDPVVPDWV